MGWGEMTTITIHRIDVSDLHTFRVRCAKCHKTTLAEVDKWISSGGRASCVYCGVDWESAGTALASLMAGLRELRKAKEPEAVIQVEVEAGTPR